MLLYAQTWLPLLTITLTAAIFFGVASFMMAHGKALATIRPEEMLTDYPLCGGSAYGPRRLLRTYAGVAARNRD